MFKIFPIFQIFKFQNFKKYSEIRGATSISDAFIVLKMVISASSSTSLNGGICFRGKSMLLSHFLLFLLIYYLFHFIFFYDAIYTRIPQYSWALLAILDNLNFFYNPLNKSLEKFLMCDNRHGH